MMDADSRLQVLADIEKYELSGEFDRHVDPVDYSIVLPVTKDFPYVRRGFDKVKTFFKYQFVVKPFRRKAMRDVIKPEVYGIENAKGIKSAVITCNHVNKFDCLALQHAFRKQKDKIYIVAAPFNNMKGAFGDGMRAGGMLPLSDDPAAMRHFIKSVDWYLQHDNFVVIYPEQAMWWNYKKPRVYKDGAYTFAVKNNVPIIPTFITYRPSGKVNEQGIEEMYLTVHVMQPIYPDPNLRRHDNVANMKKQNFAMCKAKYEQVYGEPLTYSTLDPEKAPDRIALG